MNNFSMKLKKAFSNKNFVTALCFVLIGVVLIFGYSYEVKKATTPIKVPYALVDIAPQNAITSDMVGTISIASDAVNEEIMYTDKADIIGKYADLESTIYRGSFFYKGSIVTRDELRTSALLDIPDGETLLSLDINMKSSYYNSLVPGDYFDLYVRTIGKLTKKDKENEILVGKLIGGIKILAVKTEDGRNVSDTDDTRTPAGLLFSVPEDQYLLIKKAEYFTQLQDVSEIQFVIVPRGQKYKTDEGESVTATVTSDELQEYINDKTKDIDVNEIKNSSGKITEEE